MSDWSSNSSSPNAKSEEVESNTSEGMGEDKPTSAGKDLGTCGMVEKLLAGTKSLSVKTWGLKGWMPVQEKAE